MNKMIMIRKCVWFFMIVYVMILSSFSVLAVVIIDETIYNNNIVLIQDKINDTIINDTIINDTDTLVPYTGAVNDVDLGNYSLTSTGISSITTGLKPALYGEGDFGLMVRGISFLGGVDQFWGVGVIDLGDIGSYPILAAASDGVFGDVGLIADNLLIYDYSNDDETGLNFVNNNVTNVGRIIYNFNENSFEFIDPLGTTPKNLYVTGNINTNSDYYHNENQGFTGNCINTTYSGGIAISCND